MKQQDTLTWLTRPSMHLATARAHRWREDFQEFYDLDTGQAPGYLRSWCYGAKRSRLQPIKDFVKLVETHWDGIDGWHDSRISNGLLEGTNSLIQAAKARARGYRSKTKMITIIYLIAGKLPNPSPYVIHPIYRRAHNCPVMRSGLPVPSGSLSLCRQPRDHVRSLTAPKL